MLRLFSTAMRKTLTHDKIDKYAHHTHCLHIPGGFGFFLYISAEEYTHHIDTLCIPSRQGILQVYWQQSARFRLR